MHKLPLEAYLIGGYLMPKVYELLPTETKQKIKLIIPYHHGTWASGGAFVSALSGNIPLTVSLVGVALEDRKDYPYWKQDAEMFRQSVQKKVDEIVYGIQTSPLAQFLTNLRNTPTSL